MITKLQSCQSANALRFSDLERVSNEGKIYVSGRLYSVNSVVSPDGCEAHLAVARGDLDDANCIMRFIAMLYDIITGEKAALQSELTTKYLQYGTMNDMLSKLSADADACKPLSQEIIDGSRVPSELSDKFSIKAQNIKNAYEEIQREYSSKELTTENILSLQNKVDNLENDIHILQAMRYNVDQVGPVISQYAASLQGIYTVINDALPEGFICNALMSNDIITPKLIQVHNELLEVGDDPVKFRDWSRKLQETQDFSLTLTSPTGEGGPSCGVHLVSLINGGANVESIKKTNSLLFEYANTKEAKDVKVSQQLLQRALNDVDVTAAEIQQKNCEKATIELYALGNRHSELAALINEKRELEAMYNDILSRPGVSVLKDSYHSDNLIPGACVYTPEQQEVIYGLIRRQDAPESVQINEMHVVTINAKKGKIELKRAQEVYFIDELKKQNESIKDSIKKIPEDEPKGRLFNKPAQYPIEPTSIQNMRKKIDIAKDNIESTRMLMIQNLEDVFRRGKEIKGVVRKADNIQSSARAFYKEAKSLHWPW